MSWWGFIIFNLLKMIFTNISTISKSLLNNCLKFELLNSKKLFLTKNNNFYINKIDQIQQKSLILTTYSTKVVRKIQFFNFKIYNSFFLKKLLFNLNIFWFFFLNFEELELKGINYRFCKYKTNLLLDLGNSHFQLFYYPILYFFFFLWKKKLKWIICLTFNKYNFFSTIFFFWYTLWSVGPYKLKGFQFVNEWIKLKQGKKPFK